MRAALKRTAANLQMNGIRLEGIKSPRETVTKGLIRVEREKIKVKKELGIIRRVTLLRLLLLQLRLPLPLLTLALFRKQLILLINHLRLKSLFKQHFKLGMIDKFLFSLLIIKF